jgi:hypothetical protein
MLPVAFPTGSIGRALKQSADAADCDARRAQIRFLPHFALAAERFCSIREQPSVDR